MPTRLPAGPYRTLTIEGDLQVPFYIIPFDKRGLCVGPETRQHLLDTLRAGRYSDVFLFSHGWNNDWSVAVRRYESFIEGFATMRRTRGLPRRDGYAPLLIGIFWPSTALVFTENEKGPQIASGQPAAVDAAVDEARREVAELADDLDADQARELYELAQKTRLSDAEAQRLAGIVTTFFNTPDDELGIDTTVTADELLDIWRQVPAVHDDLDDFIAVPGAGTAGFLSRLDPRNIIRTATVLKMKDRAGTVGATGVHALLSDVLAASNARVHALGHSYGAKVVLSAVCAGTLPRRLHSMLLLQPALSHLAFAQVVRRSRPRERAATSPRWRACIGPSWPPTVGTTSR